VSVPGGRQPPARALRPPPRHVAVASFILAVSLGARAEASDADLQRALLDAGCARADIVEMPSQGAVRIYRANCFGSSHKVIEAVCANHRCTVSAPAAVRGDESGDP
jgi:hypothetical protein